MVDESSSGNPLDRDIAIKATADATGVQLAAKSRLVAAIDGLCGSIFDWATAPFEGRAAKRRLRDKLDREMMQLAHDADVRRLEAPGAGRETIEGEILLEANRDAGMRQLNRFGVAVEAIEALKALPTPEAAEQAGAAGRDPEAAEPPTLDEDWMNSFARFAEDASSEQLQALWGRVLAGEIRQPGKFSKRTLRFVSELDQQTAKDCEALALRAVGKLVYKSDKLVERLGMAVLLNLEELGLISGAAGFLSSTATLDQNGRSGIFGRELGLVLHGTAGLTKSFPIIPLTRLGEEVFSLLPGPDEEPLLLEIVEALDKDGLTRIDLGAVQHLPNGHGIVLNSRIVWGTGGPSFSFTPPGGFGGGGGGLGGPR
jgi:hypothetical protein